MDSKYKGNFLEKLSTRLLIVVFLLFPLWVCFVGWVANLESVGPMVPVTWLISSFSLPVIFYSWASLVKNMNLRVILKIASIPIGVCAGYIHFISYMLLAPIFGVNGFSWM